MTKITAAEAAAIAAEAPDHEAEFIPWSLGTTWLFARMVDQWLTGADQPSLVEFEEEDELWAEILRRSEVDDAEGIPTPRLFHPAPGEWRWEGTWSNRYIHFTPEGVWWWDSKGKPARASLFFTKEFPELL